MLDRGVIRSIFFVDLIFCLNSLSTKYKVVTDDEQGLLFCYGLGVKVVVFTSVEL